MYITYDLPQTEGVTQPETGLIARGAREIQLSGPLHHWLVGEFDNASGVKSYGVRLEYVDPERGLATELIEVPSTAKNVQVHQDHLPSEYRSGLESAA